MNEVQSGLEGVVAFASEIAEPDRDGGALRYRGVDIEELVGTVPFEQVWGLLVDGTLAPGLPRRRTRRAAGAHRRHARRRPGRDRDARDHAADRQHRRPGPRGPGARVGTDARLRRPVRARRRPRAGRGRRRLGRDPLPHPLARRGRPAPRPRDRRLLDERRRARDERVDVHRARRRLHRRRRRRRAVGRRRRALRPAARRRAQPRADDARRGRARRRRDGLGGARAGRAASG